MTNLDKNQTKIRRNLDRFRAQIWTNLDRIQTEFRHNLNRIQIHLETNFQTIFRKYLENLDEFRHWKILDNLDIGIFRQFRRGSKYV